MLPAQIAPCVRPLLSWHTDEPSNRRTVQPAIFQLFPVHLLLISAMSVWCTEKGGETSPSPVQTMGNCPHLLTAAANAETCTDEESTSLLKVPVSLLSPCHLSVCLLCYPLPVYFCLFSEELISLHQAMRVNLD